MRLLCPSLQGRAVHIDRKSVRGATVTIGAMGCQREIVQTLVDKQADYIIAVKNNQPTLAQAVRSGCGVPVQDRA